MSEEQFREAVRLLFGVGTTGRTVLEDMRQTFARPFSRDPYETAFNCGRQDVIETLLEIADE